MASNHPLDGPTQHVQSDVACDLERPGDIVGNTRGLEPPKKPQCLLLSREWHRRTLVLSAGNGLDARSRYGSVRERLGLLADSRGLQGKGSGDFNSHHIRQLARQLSGEKRLPSKREKIIAKTDRPYPENLFPDGGYEPLQRGFRRCVEWAPGTLVNLIMKDGEWLQRTA